MAVDVDAYLAAAAPVVTLLALCSFRGSPKKGGNAFLILTFPFTLCLYDCLFPVLSPIRLRLSPLDDSTTAVKIVGLF